jgi:hypothetical protein
MSCHFACFYIKQLICQIYNPLEYLIFFSDQYFSGIMNSDFFDLFLTTQL